MATNADTEEKTEETEEQSEVQTDDELQQALADADKPEAEETDKETNSEAVEAEEKSEATLTSNPEPEKDLDWYKKAYENSTTEAMRLKGELDKQTPPVAPVSTDETLTPEQLYIRQKQDEEIREAFKEVSDKFPQLKEKAVYDQFVTKANTLGRVTVESEKRFPSPAELYNSTAVIMGLKPDNENLGAALKDNAASPRTSSGTPSTSLKSKVTEEMITENLKWYPNKTRQEIIKELEPHIT